MTDKHDRHVWGPITVDGNISSATCTVCGTMAAWRNDKETAEGMASVMIESTGRNLALQKVSDVMFSDERSLREAMRVASDD